MWPGRLGRRLLYWLRREQRTAELEEEMRLHVELRARQYGERGLDAGQAGVQARRLFGDVGRLVEASREVWGYHLADVLRQDVRYALRQLRRAPLFTLIASLSVAVGVIVAVSAFTLVNTLLFKPLPVPDADGIYHVYTSDYDGRAEPYGASSYRDYLDFRGSNAFADLAASATRGLAVAAADQPARQEFAGFVSANYFDVLGLRLWRGHAFQDGTAQQIVLSYPYWQRVFGGADAVIGQSLSVNSIPLTVVGVAPASFRGVGLGLPMIGWIPVAALPVVARDADALSARGSRGFEIVGRLRAGESSARASQRLNAVAAALAEQAPDSWRDRNNQTRLVSVLPQREASFPPKARGQLMMALGLGTLLVVFVVLLACTNVAALMLGRAAGREHEIAIRLTMGATRLRLVRQLFTESLLLALLGGSISFLGLLWTLRTVQRIPLTEGFDLRPDWRVMAAAAGTSVLSAFVFGLAPALHSLRADLRARFGGAATRQKNRLRGVLIALQVAIASVLILLASSAVRGVRAYLASDPGIELDGLISMEIDRSLFGDDTVRANLYHSRVQALMAGLPSVQRVSSTLLLPLGDGRTETVLTLPNGEEHTVEFNAVGSDFFATVRLGALRGRTFQSTDRRGSPPVAVVNPAFLRRFGEGPGLTVQTARLSGIEIVGVVPEIHYHDARVAAGPLIYLLDEQVPWNSSRARFLLRVAPGSERQVAVQLRRLLRQQFPDLVIPAIEPLRAHIARRTLPHRVTGNVILAVGCIELALAAIGLYGMLLFALSARRREIGVRLALGATAGAASWAVMRDGMRYAAIGIAGGIVLSIPAAMLAQQAVPGARLSDPAPFLLALASVLFAVGLAAWLPARNAGRVQPATALRHD